MFCGVASADRVRVHAGIGIGVGVGFHGRARVYAGPRVQVVRRPIYVARPVIRARYFDVRVRPALVVENYPPRVGYVWVRGAWQWNGAEWIWMPGHYAPL
jgi:hypothetical protein